MSEFAVDCSVNISNTGKPDCGLDVGRVIGHILCPQGTEFADAATAKVLANWTTKIQAAVGTRIYPLPLSWRQEYAPNENQEATGSGGKTKVLYTNVGRDTFYIPYSILTNDYVSNLLDINNGTWGVFTVTENGYIGGKSSDGTKFQAINADVRVLSREKASDEGGGDLPYTVQYDAVDDVDKFGQYVEPTDFNPKTDLEGLKDVVLAVSGSPSATTLVITVATDLNATAVTGLVLADFAFTTSGTPDSVAESPNGTYTFTDTDLLSGSVDLVAAASLTVTGIESTGSVSFTVT